MSLSENIFLIINLNVPGLGWLALISFFNRHQMKLLISSSVFTSRQGKINNEFKPDLQRTNISNTCSSSLYSSKLLKLQLITPQSVNWCFLLLITFAITACNQWCWKPALWISASSRYLLIYFRLHLERFQGEWRITSF